MIGLDTNILVHLADPSDSRHPVAKSLLQAEVSAGRTILVAPQIISEFLHVITDSKRFQTPLSMEEAVFFSQKLLALPHARLVPPTMGSVQLGLQWMLDYRLGRKRVLDSQLAATLWSAGCKRIFTSNGKDFEVFGKFELISP